MAISDDDLERLRRCVELARVALDDGDEPFGVLSVHHLGRLFGRGGTGRMKVWRRVGLCALGVVVLQIGSLVTPPATPARLARTDRSGLGAAPGHPVGLGKVLTTADGGQIFGWDIDRQDHANQRAFGRGGKDLRSRRSN